MKRNNLCRLGMIAAAAVTAHFIPAASAAKTEVLTYQFTTGPVAFLRRPAERIVVSQSCEKSDGQLACLAAAESHPHLSWKAARASSRRNGPSPGTHLCEEQRKGMVVMGTDALGDETSFCRFSDGSMIDNGSLIYQARKGQR